jgi:hypothetical protein
VEIAAYRRAGDKDASTEKEYPRYIQKERNDEYCEEESTH